MQESTAEAWKFEEEMHIQLIMNEGGLDRIKAIQIYCRMKKNIDRCLELVREES